MKKNYIQPNILVEKLDSFDVIVTSPNIGPDGAKGDIEILAPKRRGIWDNEY
jgi:hypothetical protein